MITSIAKEKDSRRSLSVGLPLLYIYLVGVAGLKPTTSASRTLRAINCATPRLMSTSVKLPHQSSVSNQAVVLFVSDRFLALSTGAVFAAAAFGAANVNWAVLAGAGRGWLLHGVCFSRGKSTLTDQRTFLKNEAVESVVQEGCCSA